jgi:hypothetical protein
MSVWKKGGITWLRGYPGIFLQKLRETTETSVRIIGALAEIRTEHLQNTSFTIAARLPSFMLFERYKHCTGIPWCVHRIIFFGSEAFYMTEIWKLMHNIITSFIWLLLNDKVTELRFWQPLVTLY